jgi:hypothetical protein
MKYGYVQQKKGKCDLFVPIAKSLSSSPKVSGTGYRQVKDENSVDQIKAKAASVPLHLTFG